MEQSPRARHGVTSPLISPSTWGRLAGNDVFVVNHQSISTPLPPYDEAVHIPELTQAYISVGDYEGRPTPMHLREKIYSRFLSAILSMISFCVICQSNSSYQLRTPVLVWCHILSMYGIIATQVLDDASVGITPQSYRWTHFLFELSMALCWLVAPLIPSRTTFNSSDNLFLALSWACALSWWFHLAQSVYVLFYTKPIEPEEGVFPDIMYREDGRIAPDENTIVWLAQPRNKVRLLQTVLLIVALAFDSGNKGSDLRLWNALNLVMLLCLCLDGAWRRRVWLKWRVIGEISLDLALILIFVFVISSKVLFKQLDDALKFLMWVNLMLQAYAVGWNVYRGFVVNNGKLWTLHPAAQRMVERVMNFGVFA